MSEYIIPTIGSNGYYNLLSPFDTKVTYTERYTCESIRKISDYVSNNEDVKQTVYLDNGLTEVDYLDDAKVNMTIAGLKSGIGHWVYVPVRFISTYPIVNGIPYRSLFIGVSLPALPLNRDISHVTTAIENIVKDSLGVTPVIKLIETSTVIQVEKSKHDTEEAARNIIINGNITDRSRYTKLMTEHQKALLKISELETYIKSKL